eukprot:134293-Pyramimonas_sp.AAC.1
MREDLAWLNTRMDKRQVPGDGSSDDWLSFVRAKPRRFVNLAVEAARRELFHQQQQYLAKETLRICQAHGLSEPSAGEERSSSE